MSFIPKKVRIALGFLIASTTIQVIGLIMLLRMGIKTPSYVDAVSVLSISCFVSIILITFMFMKHNWARITYTVLFGIGLLFLLSESRTPTIPMMLEAAGIIMLYTKDSTMWFTTDKEGT